ncbi:uncharacterized protein LOC126803076 isoform X2 [Argentina anserina]|uniref:uncharacterized protein LOC126803076 isoform X2 n=1 Tax=Argentina anserina TaxID=57926 RepID=UPI0021767686|nr:uncharacterized protein LOC126803076 isoform X2 [Potentilla anserina]
MSERWRYFRVNGDQPYYADQSLFTVNIYYGGMFHSKQGLNRRYVGGDVLYVDGAVPDKISMTESVYWAYDIGYERPPMQWWFKIPGSEDSSGFLPVTSDSEATDMCRVVSPRTRLMELFIVCEAEMRVFKDDDLTRFTENLDHSGFLGWKIDDVEDEYETTPNEDKDLLKIIEENERSVRVVDKVQEQVQMRKKNKVDKGKRHVEEAPKSQKKKKEDHQNLRRTRREA